MAWLPMNPTCASSLPARPLHRCSVVQPCIRPGNHSRPQVVRRAAEGTPATATQTTTTASPNPATSGSAVHAPAQPTPVAAGAAQPTTGSAGPSSKAAAGQPSPASPPLTSEQKQHKDAMASLDQRFREAYTMSQVYVKDRPAPIPLSEYEKRRKSRELEEITTAGKRRGVSAETIKANMEQVDKLLPGLVNLHKAKAADWVAIVKDVNVLMTKVLVIKDTFPKANLHKVLTSQPKLLLKSEDELRQDGQKVRTILAGAPDAIDTIIETVPDLMNPVNLVRSLSFVKSSFGGVDPVELIAKHPDVLLNLGEASIEDSAEYGELSTKD